MLESSIHHIAKSINKELYERLPNQRKTQRESLSLMVATMLEVRSANTMELASALPREAERIDMRYQWIERFLKNPHIKPDEIMIPFAKELLRYQAEHGMVVIQMDQSHLNDEFEVLMLSLSWEGRALPLFWSVEKTQGGIGFSHQKKLLSRLWPLLDRNVRVVLMGDRFYGTPDLIAYCRKNGWDYRLRLKNNLLIFQDGGEITTGELARTPQSYHQNVLISQKKVPTHLGIIQEEGHPEPWIIAMSSLPSFYKTLDYGLRWGIEPMFSDFKSRGFGLGNTQLQFSDRLQRLILVMTLAMYWAVSTGMWDKKKNPLPAEKNTKNQKSYIGKSPLSLKEVCVA